MSDSTVTTLSSPRPATLGFAGIHHLGVQTADLGNCVSWYQDFFGCKQNWTLDRFSELTLSRLPGIVRLVEMAADDTRFHLFERDGRGGPVPDPDSAQFQHVCMSTPSPEKLRQWHELWTELYESGRYHFARNDQATDIVTDDDGVQSFYLYDVNGLEFEFTYLPDGDR